MLLKLQPYAQSSLINRPFPKISYKFFWPYKVLERIGKAAYRLELPVECVIHPVMHVSQLKEFRPNNTPVFSNLLVHTNFSQHVLQPEQILERGLVKKGNVATPQVRVQWCGLPDTTWEDWTVLLTRFLEVASWGQDGVQGGGDVMLLTPLDGRLEIVGSN
jgi:hypothetical protein